MLYYDIEATAICKKFQSLQKRISDALVCCILATRILVVQYGLFTFFNSLGCSANLRAKLAPPI